MLRFIIPLLVFGIMVVFFAIGLTKDPQNLPSALIDKPAPSFVLPQLADASKTFSAEEMKGKVWLMNVWASWCASCRQEHPLFMELTRKGEAAIYGMDYKDKPEDGLKWLQQLGNPYVLNAADLSGDVGIDFGVYGVPETFVIDKAGIVRYRHAGPISREDWTKIFVPLMKELEG